jgi:hypothetical protein
MRFINLELNSTLAAKNWKEYLVSLGFVDIKADEEAEHCTMVCLLLRRRFYLLESEYASHQIPIVNIDDEGNPIGQILTRIQVKANGRSPEERDQAANQGPPEQGR